ncbi:short-subunit dehydrogenase [Streptomyces canus]|uniref:SDR family NAD(P)-dependent oxidoreductase n=1 Tax=Streptomyces canus TaxID=58343 RepID=UPI0027832396|nr:SDR family NAD(P)-dependent oxidoreductase [Streptomyces canus]MDQ0596535.1 short-subunit dehydrogenase [Streptomyces canus]
MRMVKEVLPHMRAQGRGRNINLSAVQGFIPAPYMAVYGASKHAIEGYSQSLDHEVRQYGVRSLLVEPAYTRTGFEANSAKPDMPLQVPPPVPEASSSRLTMTAMSPVGGVNELLVDWTLGHQNATVEELIDLCHTLYIAAYRAIGDQP